MSIDLVVPTRARPKRLRAMLDSAIGMAAEPESIKALIYFDDDDAEMLEERSVLEADYNCEFVVGPRQCLSVCWNDAYELGDSEIVMHCGDDIVFTSQGWDRRVREAFSEHGPYALVYGPDGIQNRSLATHSFTTRTAAMARGYFLPPMFVALYNDTWLFDIYSRIGKLVYLPQVAIEHMHFTKYPELMDETYSDKRSEKITEASQVWRSTMKQRLADSKKMLTAMRRA